MISKGAQEFRKWISDFGRSLKVKKSEFITWIFHGEDDSLVHQDPDERSSCCNGESMEMVIFSNEDKHENAQESQDFLNDLSEILNCIEGKENNDLPSTSQQVDDLVEYQTTFFEFHGNMAISSRNNIEDVQPEDQALHIGKYGVEENGDEDHDQRQQVHNLNEGQTDFIEEFENINENKQHMKNGVNSALDLPLMSPGENHEERERVCNQSERQILHFIK
ncbi:DgyrCDS14012 [Dimorphilus gyrociliatus]|uniref:DgyrCDS14012 n=1 Tax=Dimorphilus gyrociliatus TaxID=2664684 RepID=A0A7I8WCA2_9ANNE|nr:DgyrCDS14012 [Dimorphilus gyrociliatus]